MFFYGLILAGSIFGLLIGELKKQKIPYYNMKSILPEDIPQAINQNPIPAQVAPMPVQPISSNQFFGALIGTSGMYIKKARMFDNGESVKIGSDEAACQIIVGGTEQKVYCEICFDESMEEYQLRPLCAKGVFLKNGQPLGNNRIYCLPRGMEIIIADDKNQFQLA